MEKLFKWSWVLFCYFILWLAKPESKKPCILHCEIQYSLEFVSTNPPFFISSLQHQGSNSCCLVVNTAKIPKIRKSTSFEVYFSICKSQDRTINRKGTIQAKLINCPSHTFLKFRNNTNCRY